jgi:hypothetical protein
MTEEQVLIAEEFVDELRDLGVFEEVTRDQLVANGPMFALPKPFQPGQWRILSDMKSGGQNESIGADPTVFPKSGVVLDQLYPGGYSWVADASKFFYQFPTHPEDRKYLGAIHPREATRFFWYCGLPMGAGSSPALGGRYGAAFLRSVREQCASYRGKPDHNTWWGRYSSRRDFDMRVGHGRTQFADNGEPSALVFGHCDDFLGHAATEEKSRRSLTEFLDCAICFGLLFNPGKLTPPCKVVKYTGLYFDTRGVPTIRIPAEKRSKALAMIDYIITQSQRISRLALAVMVGTLESLVEGTPDRLGHTYTRQLQVNLHPPDWNSNELPYFSYTTLTPGAIDELNTWAEILTADQGRQARAMDSGTIIPSFGDGSGTGTGGTVQYDPAQPLEMWMGTWSPVVIHHHSNWKEARTLLATLERAQLDHTSTVRDRTFFYFTDNLVLYFIVSAGASKSPVLHKLLTRIKLIALTLNVQLEVVHIPGTSIITQGTDGLSRGVWMSQLHTQHDQDDILASIFAPIPYLPYVKEWARQQIGLPVDCLIQHSSWQLEWRPRNIMHRLTLWMPPPEIAPQLLHTLLQVYVEAPLTTAMIIIVPCVIQKRWSRLSRSVVEIGRYPLSILPHTSDFLLQIPFVLLYIPYHHRSLPSARLDTSTSTALRRHHRQQATLVRGVLGAT